jgi:hypothetical protein
MYYLCFQKVEEEISSAGEQLISNKLSALYSKREGDGNLLSLFFTLLVSPYGLKKPNTNVSKNSPKININYKKPTKQPSISRHNATVPFFS